MLLGYITSVCDERAQCSVAAGGPRLSRQLVTLPSCSSGNSIQAGFSEKPPQFFQWTALSYSGHCLCEGSCPSLEMHAHGSGLVVSQFLYLILSF